MLKHLSTTERRRLGTYYTPASVANVLCERAIRRPGDRVLEPSFGGCEFLESSIRRLETLGAKNPTVQLFGCDVDEEAFRHLQSRLEISPACANFFKGDFLSLTEGAFGGIKFEVALGNPPYVRHHRLTAKQKAAARLIRDRVLPGLSLQFMGALHSSIYP